MAKQKRSGGKSKTPQPEALKGWQEIAAFLGEPTEVFERRVQKECRYVAWAASLRPLPMNSTFLGRETGEPANC